MNEPIQSLLSKCLYYILNHKKKYNKEQLTITYNIFKNIYIPIYYEEYKFVKQIDLKCWDPSEQIGNNTFDYFHICNQIDIWPWICKCKFIIEKKYGEKCQFYWILRCSRRLEFNCGRNLYGERTIKGDPNYSLKTINDQLNKSTK